MIAVLFAGGCSMALSRLPRGGGPGAPSWLGFAPGVGGVAPPPGGPWAASPLPLSPLPFGSPVSFRGWGALRPSGLGAVPPRVGGAVLPLLGRVLWPLPRTQRSCPVAGTSAMRAWVGTPEMRARI